MNKIRYAKPFLAACMIGAFLFAGSAWAHDYRLGALHIDHPWAVATPMGAQVGGGYMKITNEGTQPDRLIAITSPAAGQVMIHDSVMEGDVVKMRMLDKGIEIKPGETVELKPGGMHVMFEKLRAPLVAKERLKATLVFEKAGKIDVDYAIEPIGTRAPAAPVTAHQH